MNKKLYLLLFSLLYSISPLAQKAIKNGDILPPHGEFRVFMVFVEVDYSQGSCYAPCSLLVDDLGPNSNWPIIHGVTQVPTDAHTYFNPNQASYNASPAFISDLYYKASFGAYKLFGDYYPKVIKVNCSQINTGSGLDLILGKLQEEYVQNQYNPLVSASGMPLSDFDNWTPTSQGLPKLNNGDNKIDLLYIIWKNNKYLSGCNHNKGASDNSGQGVHLTPGISFAGMDGVNTVTSFNASNSAPGGYTITLMEHMHGTFGGNHWHSGGGAGFHTFIAKPDNYPAPIR